MAALAQGCQVGRLAIQAGQLKRGLVFYCGKKLLYRYLLNRYQTTQRDCIALLAGIDQQGAIHGYG